MKDAPMQSAPRKPVVSVALPVYNAAKYLPDAVASVLNQTFRDFEVIAIDDGSTDESKGILETFAAQDPRLRVVSRPNTGYAVALNEAISLARGEFIARMDSDDVSLPGRFERQVQFMRSHSGCVAAGTRVQIVDPDGQPICTEFTLTAHEDIDRFHLQNASSAIAHPSAMIRRDVLLELGGYRTAFEPAEDLDLWLRLAERGSLANLDELLFRYRMHPKSATTTRQTQMRKHAALAVAEAKRRRGVADHAVPPADSPHRREVQPMHGWVVLAYSRREYGNARRLAVKALRKSPTSSESWRMLLLAMLGPAAKFVVKARHAIGLGR